MIVGPDQKSQCYAEDEDQGRLNVIADRLGDVNHRTVKNVDQDHGAHELPSHIQSLEVEVRINLVPALKDDQEVPTEIFHQSSKYMTVL